MENTNTIIIETYPDNNDFQKISLNMEIYHFNAAILVLIIMNSNKEGKLRISLDLDYFNGRLF